MSASSLSRRLLKRWRDRSAQATRERRGAPLRVRGLERRIVLDATIAVGGGSVDIAITQDDASLNVTADQFNIGGSSSGTAIDVYRFNLDTGSWNNGASGPIDLDGLPGFEAYIDGQDLYVSKAFLESNAGGLSVGGAVNNAALSLQTNVLTTGAQDYGVLVELQTSVTLTAPIVSFQSGVAGAGNDLTVSGNTTFGDAVTGVDDLHVTGTTLIATDRVTTTGAQQYDGDVTLGDNAVLSGTTVTFNGKVLGDSHSLEVAGNAVFGDAVSGLTTLTVSGTTAINAASISSTGTQTFEGAVTLGQNATLTGSQVVFHGSVQGAGHSLTISGNAVFGNGAGDTVTGLTTLQVSGDSSINTSQIATSGTQSYGGDVTLGTAATLNASQVHFQSDVVGGNNSLRINGAATFGNASSDTLSGLTTLEVTGTALINAGLMSSSGTQTYQGAVTLGADIDIVASTAIFNGQVIGGGHALDVTGGAVFGNGPGDTVTGLSTLAVSGATAINTTNVTTIGAQTFGGDVTLGANTTLTGSTIAFNSRVLGDNRSLNIQGNAILGNEAGDSVTGLASLFVSGAGTINTSTVSTTGNQTYNGPVTIGLSAGTAVLTSSGGAVLFGNSLQLQSNLTVTTGTGNVTFTGTVNGPRALVVNSSGATTFSAAVGGTEALQSLTTNAGGSTALNGGTVTTTGAQSYGDTVSLGTDTTLTSLTAAVTFLAPVLGNSHALAIAGNAIFGDQATDTFTGLTTLSVSGSTTIRTNTITTTGSQTYTGPVTVAAADGLATLTTTNSEIEFGSTTTLQSDLTVTTGRGDVTWAGAIDGQHDLIVNSTGVTAFNGLVGGVTPLASVTTNAGGTTQINGGGVLTSGDQTYRDNVEIGPGTQQLAGDTIHFFGGVDGRLDRQGDLNITSANAVLFDRPVGAIRDVGSIKVRAVDVTFANGTFIEVGNAAAESVRILATGTLVLPTGFVVRAAFNGADYDGVANTFLPRPAPGIPGTALVDLPKDRPIFSSRINPDQTATGTIDLTVGNAGEKGLRVFIDWGNTVSQDDRFEGPNGWADGDGSGDNSAPGDLFAIDGGSTVRLTHLYTPADVQAQLRIDNTFDVQYAVFQHEAIVIEAARVEQGRESLGTPGGPTTVLTTTMRYDNAADPRFEPPPPGSVPDLVSGTIAVQIPPPAGGVPFEIPVARPELVFAPINDSPPLDPLVTPQQVTKDDAASSAPVVGREQRFVLRLLSPDPTAPPLAEVDLPADSFQADRLERLFRELPDGAYEIDLLLGENTERPILRFDIRQGRPVVPQESLDGGQLRLEDIQDTLKKHSSQLPAPPQSSSVEQDEQEADSPATAEQSSESHEERSSLDSEAGNSSLPAPDAGTMSSRLQWQLRRQTAVREGSLTLASRLARRLNDQALSGN